VKRRDKNEYICKPFCVMFIDVKNATAGVKVVGGGGAAI
jgi:hypothetical protein